MKKLALIFLAAVLLRFFFVGFWHVSGHGAHLSSDAAGYQELAESIKDGRGFQMDGAPSARRPPLFPLWIAVFLNVGWFPLGVQLGDALLGALSCLLLYGIGKELFNPSVGLLSAAVLAVDYASVRQIVSIMSETLFLFFLLISFLFLIKAFKSGKGFLFFLSGLFGGLSLLTREVLILYFPAVAVWCFFAGPGGKSRFVRSGFFLLGLALATGPWIVRNSLLYHRPVLITTSAGHSFYIANNPETTGGRTGGSWEWDKDSHLPADPNLKLFRPETDQALLESGVQFIVRHPGRFISLMGTKIINTWRPYQADSPPLSRWAIGLPYVFIVCFAVLGIVLSVKRWKEFLPIYMFIAYIFILHAILIAEVRYRYPVMPFLMIFASFAVVTFFHRTCDLTHRCRPK